MAQIEVVTLACDVCGREGEGVETHTLEADKKRTEVELCARHWEPFSKRFEILAEAGRRPRKKAR